MGVDDETNVISGENIILYLDYDVSFTHDKKKPRAGGEPSAVGNAARLTMTVFRMRTQKINPPRRRADAPRPPRSLHDQKVVGVETVPGGGPLLRGLPYSVDDEFDLVRPRDQVHVRDEHVGPTLYVFRGHRHALRPVVERPHDPDVRRHAHPADRDGLDARRVNLLDILLQSLRHEIQPSRHRLQPRDGVDALRVGHARLPETARLLLLHRLRGVLHDGPQGVNLQHRRDQALVRVLEVHVSLLQRKLQKLGKLIRSRQPLVETRAQRHHLLE